MQFICHQIDSSNLKFELEYLKKLQLDEYLIIGIEVTNNIIETKLHFNIDPQHNNSNPSTLTAIEKVYYLKDEFSDIYKTFDKIAYIILKPDADAIGATALLHMIIMGSSINSDMIERIIDIAKSDTHGRKTRKQQLTYPLKSALCTMIADFNLDLSQKVINTGYYLKNGNFNESEKYELIAKERLAKAKSNTEVKILLKHKIVHVKSRHRGATSKGYQIAPIVIAENNHYIFNNTKEKFGTKYTIAQYKPGNINLIEVTKQLNKIEPGWGGSYVIIGSPQDRPSNISVKQLFTIMKRCLIK